jgi:hypothetical protein
MIIIMISTIVVSYLVYHIGKQVGINKRNKELLNNVNKFKLDVIEDKETGQRSVSINEDETEDLLQIDVRTGMWNVKKNNKKNDK